MIRQCWMYLDSNIMSVLRLLVLSRNLIDRTVCFWYWGMIRLPFFWSLNSIIELLKWNLNAWRDNLLRLAYTSIFQSPNSLFLCKDMNFIVKYVISTQVFFHCCKVTQVLIYTVNLLRVGSYIRRVRWLYTKCNHCCFLWL